MPQHKNKNNKSDHKTKSKKGSYDHQQPEQHPVEILKTSKASNFRSPLREDLAEKPTRENKAVRDSERQRNREDD